MDSQIFIGITNILIALSMLFLGLAVYRHTRETKRLETLSSIKDDFNALNILALQSDENLVTLDRITRPEFADESNEAKRERYLSFLLMNALERVYFERSRDNITKTYADETLSKLIPFLYNDKFAKHFYETGYDPEFLKYCEEYLITHNAANKQVNKDATR